MDVLYVVGTGSRHGNIELRMSLRSIAKYGTGIGKVIVAGHPPEWLSREVVKVCVNDRYSYKHSNILSCIETAVDQGLVAGDFLYSSDDHFYCSDVDFDNYPYFVKGELRNSVSPSDPFYNYRKSLCDTNALCRKHGFPTRNYSQHCNTHMNAEVFKAIRPVVHESYGLRFGAEPTSLLMNAWQTFDDAPPVTKREDLKIVKAADLSDIWRQIGDRDCFSIGDSAFRGGAIERFFREEYDIKSVFEAD